MRRTRVLVAGAAGRDFHNFNVAYRERDDCEVIAFTATQIPNIEGRGPARARRAPVSERDPDLPEDELEELIAEWRVDEVVFSYSDVSHEHVMHLASRTLGAGAAFRLLSLHETYLHCDLPVVAVCAVRTGSGKSQTTRRVAQILREDGKRVAVLRHPMPYGDLRMQVVQRFAHYDDLAAADTTIEEREEYEPHLAEGNLVFAGIDYAAILAQAETEADVILWDGGNNDTPFIEPTLHLVVVDPHRPGHELRYHPGETNFRMADVCVVNKIDSASPENVESVFESIRGANPRADRARGVADRRRGRCSPDQREARTWHRGRAHVDPRRGRRGARGAERRRRARRPARVRGRVDPTDVRGLPAHGPAPSGDGVRQRADHRAARDDRALRRGRR